MNWITQKKRLAIYLRDGCACGYCGSSVETGAQLTLDHVLPHARGGTNHETNLFTACKPCNDSRGDRLLSAWISRKRTSLRHANSIYASLKRTALSLQPFLSEAKNLIARRGSARLALATYKK
jgi:5-methylcytosine-specific restriction endonuclease McrA